MIVLENDTKLPIPLERLEGFARDLTQREIDLTVCNNATIQEYNRTYRNRDKATDVLSFPLEGEFDHLPLGSIVISADYVIQEAQRLGHSTDDELSLLFIHGLLHLLGYDHECDNGEMRLQEVALIQKFNLPASLIIRTEG